MLIPLWQSEIPYFDPEKRQNPPSMSPFLLPGTKNPCCLIIPGGGYSKKAWDHEGIQIAEWLNKIGMSAFVLDYRIAPYDGNAILADGQQALRLIRQGAERYGIDPSKIGVCGFSAGGHLAASCAVYYKNREERPDFALLCYGVLTLEEGTHAGTAAGFLGKEKLNKEAQKKWSPVNNVTPDCPPMFFWTTETDTTVPPVQNTHAMYKACVDAGIPTEIVTYDHGVHGLGIPADDPEIAGWTNVCEAWMKKQKIL